MSFITPIFNTTACVVSVFRKFGPGVTYITNATSEQIKADTALAHACQISLFAESGPADLGQRHVVCIYTAEVYTTGHSHESVATYSWP